MNKAGTAPHLGSDGSQEATLRTQEGNPCAIQRQLFSPRYTQHCARVLFVAGQANQQERAEILEAIFELSRQEINMRVEAGTLNKIALAAHDYDRDRDHRAGCIRLIC